VGYTGPTGPLPAYFWDASGANLYYNSGNVGINTATPTALLDVNGTAQAIAFNTISDYRIKINVNDLTNTMFDSIRPVEYYNIISKRIEYGFIAHELQMIYPELVKGIKDGVDYQSINYSGLIPLLVKELQDIKLKMSKP
jgi:hypothetical protein